MKSLRIFVMIGLMLASGASAQKSVNEFWDRLDQFFWAYVEDGRVVYEVIKKRPEYLNDLVKELATFNLDNLPDQDAIKAFWINAYNVLVIYQVVEHYPIRSPKDVGGFFETRTFTVAGEALTLNDIENKKLREPFADPRFHFVLVCAARGCPPIIQQAYRPETLEKQLDERSKDVLNHPAFVRWDSQSGAVYLSEIFHWYKDDFLAGHFTVIEFINQYREHPIPENGKIKYIPYDWTLNDLPPAPARGSSIPPTLQSYTPSTLLAGGQLELKQFNNVYTQTAFYDRQGKKQEDGNRATYYTGIVNILYGISSTINIGVDAFLKSVRIDAPGSSAFSVFSFSMGNNARTALASIAPKIKVAPFPALRRLAVQTALVIPLASDLEGQANGKPFLDYEGVQWWTQLFYDYSLAPSLLIYMESGVFFRFESERTDLLTPLRIFFNYYPNQQWTVYFPMEITPTWESGGGWSSYYSQIGIGAKYLISSFIELETLYTFFPAGKNNGAGETYNLGIRLIR